MVEETVNEILEVLRRRVHEPFPVLEPDDLPGTVQKILVYLQALVDEPVPEDVAAEEEAETEDRGAWLDAIHTGDGLVSSRTPDSLTIAVAKEPEGTTLMPEEAAHFWAEIVTETASGEYTFKEKVLTDGTTWADLTGGRTGTCYETNDVICVAVGTIIRVAVEHDTGGDLRYVFDWTVPAGPDTDYKVLQRKSDDTINWDWVRAH